MRPAELLIRRTLAFLSGQIWAPERLASSTGLSLAGAGWTTNGHAPVDSEATGWNALTRPAVQSLASALHVGATLTREWHFDATDLSQLRALMGEADDATLLGALLSSHLMGCAVQLAHDAEPNGTTVTVNHRVHRKNGAAAGRNVKMTVRLVSLQWSEALDAWTLDLEGQAHDAVTQAGLMTSCTTLRVMPG